MPVKKKAKPLTEEQKAKANERKRANRKPLTEEQKQKQRDRSKKFYKKLTEEKRKRLLERSNELRRKRILTEEQKAARAAYNKSRNRRKVPLLTEEEKIANRKESARRYRLATKPARDALRDSVRVWIYEYKRTLGCHICGETDPDMLDLHHIDPSLKEKAVGSLAGNSSLAKVQAEASKCIVLCANHHRKLHADDNRNKREERAEALSNPEVSDMSDTSAD